MVGLLYYPIIMFIETLSYCSLFVIFGAISNVTLAQINIFLAPYQRQSRSPRAYIY